MMSFGVSRGCKCGFGFASCGVGGWGRGGCTLLEQVLYVCFEMCMGGLECIDVLGYGSVVYIEVYSTVRA